MNWQLSVLLARIDRQMTHEVGHALMCHFLGVSYCGVCYDSNKPGFCTPADVEHAQLTENDRLVLAAGAAAQRVVPPINDYDAEWRDGIESDKQRFPDEESFRRAVDEAFKKLALHKATIDSLCIRLCNRIKQYTGRVECLPTCTIKGHIFYILLSSDELAVVLPSNMKS